MSDIEQQFHGSVKPSWTTNGTLVYGIAGDAPRLQGTMMQNLEQSIVSEGKDIRLAKIVPAEDVSYMQLTAIGISNSSQTKTPSLDLQFSKTQIVADSKNVSAIETSTDISFAALAETVKGDSLHAKHEKHVWRLSSILFDPLHVSCSDFVPGVPSEEVSHFEQQIRCDAVSEFWKELVHEDAASHVKDVSSAEEKALAYLSGGDVEGACTALIDGRDFRLATIISQLPSSNKAKDLMRNQIDKWHSQNMLSEMTPTIRALYEISAGQVTRSEGKQGAGEDRAPTFFLADHFKLDSKRAFGLRLWYASEGLADAIEANDADVKNGVKGVRQSPYFMTNGSKPSWDDLNAESREDTLFGLLRVYAMVGARPADLFAPATVSGNPLNARLAWQLATLLHAKGVLTLKPTIRDELTLSFASQLETASAPIDAFRTLLHLSTQSARDRYVQDLLSRTAATIGTNNESGSMFQTLVSDLKVPESYLWRAKAQYAASTHDDVAQVTYLLHAGDRVQAHTVLCRSVGPKAVVSMEYDALRELLGGFMDNTTVPAKSGQQQQSRTTKTSSPVEGWKTGGQVYFDFVHLMDLSGRDNHNNNDDEIKEEKAAILKRLATALPGMAGPSSATGSGSGSGNSKKGLEERVAIGEMASIVAREGRKMDKEEVKEVLGDKRIQRLPVHDDVVVGKNVSLAGLYYRAIGVQ